MSSSTSSSSSWWRILAGNPHDCCWSYFPYTPCVPCLPCSCPSCPTESFWVRPEEWPVLPEFSSDVDQRIVGLVAVEDTDLEAIAILCEGDYQVDWGDGTVDLVAGGVKAEHRYTYADITTNPLSYGYKTVIVTVTPQTGSNITSVNFYQRHADAASAPVIAKWLDLDLSIPNCTSLQIDAGSYVLPLVSLAWLEQVTIREHSLTSAYELFQYCYALSSVPLFDTANITDMYSMFWDCGLLKSVPLFDTSSVTDMSLMFESCYSLLCVPQFVTAQVNTMYFMFDYCLSLACIPQFNTSAVTDMSGLFNYCHSFSCMPPLDTSACTQLAQAFEMCTSLMEIPATDTSSLYNLYRTFYMCFALARLPDFSSNLVTSLQNTFRFCESLSAIPSIASSLVTTTTSFTQYADVLSESGLSGLRYNHEYRDKPISAAALNQIFTSLGTAVAGQSINITGCYGASDPACDRTIATSKGWIVTG